MGEYLKYSVLIFVPVGCFIAWYLHRQGVKEKYIAGIVALSLLIIFTFPLVMANFGFAVACIIYLALLTMMAAILNRIIEQSSLFPERVVTESGNFAMTGEARTEAAGINDLGSGSAIEDRTDQGRMESVAAEATMDSGLEPDPTEADLLPEDQAFDQMLTSSLEAFMVKENSAELLEEPISSNIEPAPAVSDDTELSDSAAEVLRAPADITDKISAEKESLHIIKDEAPVEVNEESIDSIAVNSSSAASSSADLPEDSSVQIEDDQEIIPSIIEGAAEEAAEQLEMIDESAEAAAQSGGIEESAEQVEEVQDLAEDPVVPEENDNVLIVNQYLEEGFSLKLAGDEKGALGPFALAYDLSSDEELRAMLAMEIATLSQNLGYYQEAEQILLSTIANIKNQTDIIETMKFQLRYIKVLHAELDRLGIAAIPFSQVPRWVRLTVAEKVQSGESRREYDV